MGGRGGSGISYSSADKVLIKEKPLEVERMTNLSDSGNVVLSAKTDGKGNLVLGYPETLGYRKQNSKTTYAQHKIEHGMTNTTATGKRMNLTSVGINWDKVNSVSGKTYGTQHFMRERGFTWNGAKKIWERKK